MNVRKPDLGNTDAGLGNGAQRVVDQERGCRTVGRALQVALALDTDEERDPYGQDSFPRPLPLEKDGQ